MKNREFSHKIKFVVSNLGRRKHFYILVLVWEASQII